MGGLDVGQRVGRLVKREGEVDHGAQRPGFDQRRDLSELGAVGAHEQERVADAEALGGPSGPEAEQRHDGQQRDALAQLGGEGRVRWSGDADRKSTGFEHGQRTRKGLAAL